MTQDKFPSQVAANAMAQALFEKLQAATWPAPAPVEKYGDHEYVFRFHSGNPEERKTTAFIVMGVAKPDPDGASAVLFEVWVRGYRDGTTWIEYQPIRKGLTSTTRRKVHDLDALVAQAVAAVEELFADEKGTAERWARTQERNAKLGKINAYWHAMSDEVLQDRHPLYKVVTMNFPRSQVVGREGQDDYATMTAMVSVGGYGDERGRLDYATDPAYAAAGMMAMLEDRIIELADAIKAKRAGA